jgi:hypothetical protein
MNENTVTSTDLVGQRVRYRWVHNTTENGTIRAVYVTANGFPMLLVESDHDHTLVRVAPADAEVPRG